VIPLILTGQLKNGTPIAGSDVVTILKPGKQPTVVPPVRKVVPIAPKVVPPMKGQK
jgi:hypothetical protein